MPLVGRLPDLVAQQKAESLPHFSQTCFTSLCAPLPTPVTVIVLLQLGQRCFSPTVIVLTWPFCVVTLWITTDLHLVQTMANGVTRLERVSVRFGIDALQVQHVLSTFHLFRCLQCGGGQNECCQPGAEADLAND